jgi:superfamily II DNA or RNA helicase
MQKRLLLDKNGNVIPNGATLSDLLTLSDIAIYVADTSFHRGRNYQKLGRVFNFSITPDFKDIKASVLGSQPDPYEVSITLDRLPTSRMHISGTCSCPMGHNCKHVAATLIEALERSDVAKELSKPAEGKQKPNGPAPVAVVETPLPYEVTAWLQQLAQAANGDTYPPEINQRLLYLVTSFTPLNAAPHLAVDVLAARVLKTGEFSDSNTRPVLSSYYSGNWPRYFRFSDIQICQTLQAARNGSLSYNINSFQILQAIVATGRAYWRTQENEPLKMGEPRGGQIEWTMADARGMRPVLNLEGAIALNSEPPVYVDTKLNLIGEISLPLAPVVTHRLLNAPFIPPSQVEQVSQSLKRYLPNDSVFLPKPPAPPIVVNADPKPALRLMLGQDSLAGYRMSNDEVALARLTYRYGPVAVPVGETQPVIEAVIGTQRYQAKRRPGWEKQMLSRLFALDLRFAREIYALSDPRLHQDLAFSDPYFWLDFLSNDVPQLEAEGFEVSVDNDFPYRLAKPTGDIDTEVFEGARIDWFELGMGVEVEGQKLDLAPMLANLVMTEGLDSATVTAMAEGGEDIYIPLDDGRHLALAAKRFLPVIVALHELTMGGSVVAKNGRIQISKAETALLTVLEQQEGIVFKGLESLRRLAALGSGGIPPVLLPDSFKAVLRPYQSEGLAWLNLLREVGLGGILADDMGLGKTVQILALLSLEKAEGRLKGPALIIAPTSLMTNWQNEARKFAPDLRLLLLHGAARKERFDEIAGHDIVLTTYPLIARDQGVLLQHEWHMAILDEAQIIKNPNAATTRLIRDLKCSHRFCLTGTPMENHLGELWSLMSFVNPGYLGDKTNFARRWRNPIEKHADTDRSQTLARRVKPFMLRRTKQEVAGELPPKTEITETIVLDDQQRDVYDSIRLSMHKKVRQAIAAKGLAKSHIIILEALLKLRQVCCDPRLLKLSSSKVVPSAKLERLMAMLQELLAEGRKIIVFSQFTSMLDIITQRFQAAGIAYSLLTGDTRDRKTAIESFQTGLVNVFLVSLKAGGVGLNLTAADTVILYDPWWNPAVEEQAIDRAYRIGQDKPVFVYRLVASQTIEEKMDELKAKKRALASSIFDQAGNPSTALTEEDLNDLFEV